LLILFHDLNRLSRVAPAYAFRSGDLKSSDINNYFAARSPDMHMRWNMVLRINHYLKPILSKHCRHDWDIIEIISDLFPVFFQT